MLGECREQRPSPPASALTLQVGITLHYSSLSTLLWMGVKARVLHKELTWRPPPSQDGDPALPAPRPMLRYVFRCGRGVAPSLRTSLSQARRGKPWVLPGYPRLGVGEGCILQASWA